MKKNYSVVDYCVTIVKVNLKTKTHGNGEWSNVEKDITITHLELRSIDKYGGLLYARFDPKKWIINRHGLIYTDGNWIKDFKNELVKLGFSENSLKGLDYTENGMQTKNEVSLHVSRAFVLQWKKLFKI